MRLTMCGVVLLLALTGCAAVSDGAVFGPVWWLTEIRADGEPVDLDGLSPVHWQFVKDGCERLGLPEDCGGGDMVQGFDGCNSFSRVVEVDGRTLQWGDYGYSTDVACSGKLADAMRGVGGSNELAVGVIADQLRVRDDRHELVFDRHEDPLGPAPGRVIEEGQVDEVAYRLMWSGRSLELEQDDTADPVFGPGQAGVGAGPGRVNAMRAQIGQREYLFGIVPAEASRVEYDSGGQSVDLPILDVGDPDYQAVGGFVEGPSTWTVTAYAEDGAEIHRLRWG